MSQRETIVEEIGRRRLSAILRTDDATVAARAMRAAVKGGFRVVEFTLTTPGAYELIREFAADSRLVVGAGTVLTVEDARRAVESGARFLVSPIVDAAILAEARELDVASIPGTFTPTEMMLADRAGADLVKLFPAPADIPRHVSQVLGPLSHLKIVPTAGVDATNFMAILAAGAYAVGFVASLFPHTELAQGAFDAIEKRARQVARCWSSAG